MEKEFKVIKRTCDSCGKSFKVKVVASGRYRVVCPHCKEYVSFAVSKEEAPRRVLIAPRIISPELGHAEKVKDKLYVIKKRAIVYRPYKAVCPDCGQEIALLPTVTGKVIKTKCEKCGTIIAYKAVAPKKS